MRRDNKKESQALFQSISDDGTHWLFVILGNDEWVITRDEEEVASGTSDRASIQSGVQQFMSITKDEASPAEPCAVVTQESQLRSEVQLSGTMSERLPACRPSPSFAGLGRQRKVVRSVVA